MMKHTGLTDDDLMARLAGGDEEAARTLVERWEGPIFAFLERMLGSKEDAQDLGQETFLRVCRNAGSYRPSGKFRSWLFRTAGNLARSRLRRRRLVQWISFDPGFHDRYSGGELPDRDIESDETNRAVREALGRLPARQRQAILLRHYENMTYAEIADAMGTTVSAVETLLHRAVMGLRMRLLRERTNG
jgi:RNA polymerase sigma-70 factor (ECF subfamily)